MAFVDRVAKLLGPRLSYRLVHAWWWLRRPVVIGVRTVVLGEGQVLLVRHAYRRGWFFPGGMVSRGESLEEAARRETLEETGIEVHDMQLLGVYTSFAQYITDHVVVFTATPGKTVGEPDHEIAATQWFALDALPGTVDGSVRRRLDEVHAGVRGLHGRW
jgi:8-oxo-dGTP pyrophosphatase MutT (NUDIX family)